MKVVSFLALLMLLCCSAGSDGEKYQQGEESEHITAYSRHIRKKFEQSFHDKCTKYPFVDKWVQSLEGGMNRNYYTFMFQENGLKNGGLGDRLGGLLTAVGTALRTNRTLLIESDNDFHELFRPYHPEDIKLSSNGSKYSWRKKDWKKWTNVSRKYSGNDEWELDLWYCINCPAWRNKICGLDDGDTSMSHNEPYVRLRGNRAFICKWASHPEMGAHKQLLNLVHTRDADTVNWYEVAGCMLRLVMWPTERLWDHVSAELEKQLKPQLDHIVDKHAWDSSRSVQIAAHFRCGDYSYIEKDRYNHACIHDVSLDVPPGTGGEKAESKRQEQVSRESPYMGSGSPDKLGSCVGELVYNHTVLKQDLSVYKSDGQVAKALARRNKADRGKEAQRRASSDSGWFGPTVMQHLRSLWEVFAPSSPSLEEEGVVEQKTTRSLRQERRRQQDDHENRSGSPMALLYITSDNPASAKQIEEYARKGYECDSDSSPHGSSSALNGTVLNGTVPPVPTILAPKGCHVEMDPSWDCSLLTVSQWIILSASDYIVTQTDKTGSPISAYSRYAAVYGLKGDSLRDNRHCGVVQSMYDISRRWNGNWFCD